jgi:tetratricopeptide (TPR) repeat protein
MSSPPPLALKGFSMHQFMAWLAAAVLFLALPPAARGAESLTKRVHDLPWTGSGVRGLALFKEAQASNLKDSNTWFKLGMVLYDGRSYRPAMACFRRITDLGGRGCCVSLRFSAHVWQGHLYDLLARRQDALKHYESALALEKKNGGLTVRHDQYGMVVDRAWVTARLKTPFVR